MSAGAIVGIQRANKRCMLYPSLSNERHVIVVKINTAYLFGLHII